MALFQVLYLEWRNLLDNRSDPRVKDWFMMDSPVPTILLVAAYIYFVKVLGPKWMRNRQPFKIDKILIVYNIIQICLSVYIFRESASAWVFGGYSYRCEPVDYSNNILAMKYASACWVYFISKFLELLDTIFYVLRKKQNQVTVLHVYHHSMMCLATYFVVKFVAGGHGTFLGFLNTFVHTIMYSYYLISGLGPKYQKFLWWKKYLTVLQLAQFALIFVHSGQLLFIECNYPKIYVWWYVANSAIIAALFLNFYVKTYRKKDFEVKEKTKTS